MTLEEENKVLRNLLTSAYHALHIVAFAYRRECSGKSICWLCSYNPPAGMDYPIECPGFYKDYCFRWYLSDNVSAFIPIKEVESECYQ